MISSERTLVSMFNNQVKRLGDKIAIMEKSGGEYKGFTYKEFRSRVERVAAGLANGGAQKGDKIALMSENRSEWVVSDLGILSLGAITVPIYPTITPQQIEYILNRLTASKQVTFFDLVSHIRDRLAIVVTFIAMLELMKRGELIARQSDAFGEIWIVRKSDRVK